MKITDKDVVVGFEIVCVSVPDHAKDNYTRGGIYKIISTYTPSNNYDVLMSDNNIKEELDNPDDYGYYWYITEVTAMNIFVPREYLSDEDIFALKLGADL